MRRSSLACLNLIHSRGSAAQRFEGAFDLAGQRKILSVTPPASWEI
jgi:hypothetical protein